MHRRVGRPISLEENYADLDEFNGPNGHISLKTPASSDLGAGVSNSRVAGAPSSRWSYSGGIAAKLLIPLEFTVEVGWRKRLAA